MPFGSSISVNYWFVSPDTLWSKTPDANNGVEALHNCCIIILYLHYVAPEDIHVYSVDEAFIDCTCYLAQYEEQARLQGVSPAHVMARTMIREVLATTGITATVGIGTNLYLAKVAMDIVAKKAPADEDGVRIAELDELSYRRLLWDHRPLTDF